MCSRDQRFELEHTKEYSEHFFQAVQINLKPEFVIPIEFMKLIKCHGNGYGERGNQMHRYKGENGLRRVKLEWAGEGRVGKGEGKEINKRKDLLKKTFTTL